MGKIKLSFIKFEIMEASKIEENRLRLKEKFGNTKLGGKGTQTRHAKNVHKTTINSDSKLKGQLKKFGAQPLPDIAEVNMFCDDNTVMQFKRPEVHGSIPNQTMVVFGAFEQKNLKEVFSEIMTQMGPKQLEKLKNMSFGAPGKKGEEPIKEEEGEEEDAPELVEVKADQDLSAKFTKSWI